MRYCCSLVNPWVPTTIEQHSNAFADPILRGIKSNLSNSAAVLSPSAFVLIGLLALIVTLWIW